jgi:hypothetical protein
MTESLSQKQKVKQKTDIKININLADKRKRRKQRKKRKVNNFQTLQRAQQERAQQILYSQATTIPRTVEQQNSGMIMDNFRNQQQQLNKHSSLINTGISQLNFMRDQIKNYQPVKETASQQTQTFKFEIPDSPTVKVETADTSTNTGADEKRIKQYFKSLADLKEKASKGTPIRDLFISITDGQEPLPKNVKNSTLLSKILENRDYIETALLFEEGKRAIDKANVDALEQAIKEGKITTKRGGGGNPLFQPEEEQAGLMGGMFGGGDGY